MVTLLIYKLGYELLFVFKLNFVLFASQFVVLAKLAFCYVTIEARLLAGRFCKARFAVCLRKLCKK